MGYIQKVKYYNAFLLRKFINPAFNYESWPSLPYYDSLYGLTYPSFLGVNYPTFPLGPPKDTSKLNWYVEEARIKGGYNNTSIGQAARAYLTQDNSFSKRQPTNLIYSGIINSATEVNRTNVFSSAENIKRTLDPFYGSVQYLFAEDTNLIVFQENKVSSALIDKDAIYTAEGLGLTNSGQIVIGQLRPYLGNWGISRNPESFATYGYRKYFVDKDRSAILRLSRDGITEISQYGMRDYFRDELAVISENVRQKQTYTGTLNYGISANGEAFDFDIATTDVCDLKIGTVLEVFDGTSYVQVTDQATGNPVIISDIISTDATTTELTFNYLPLYGTGWNPPLPWTQGNISTGSLTVRFTTPVKDKILGAYDLHDDSYVVSIQDSIESTFDTVNFDEEVNGWVSFHSYKPLVMKSLNDSFYSFHKYGMWKHYSDIGLNRTSYYGTRYGANITFIFNDEPHVVKNFLTIDYEGSNGWQCDSVESDVEQANNWNYNLSTPYYTEWGSNFDKINRIYSYEEGAYDVNGNTPPQSYPIFRGGFDRKENQYTANMVSSSAARAGEVIFNTDSNKAYPASGIKGYYSTVVFSTDENTQTGGKKELFSVGTRYVTSSY